MARTVTVFSYANQINAEMTRDDYAFCAQVRNDGVLENGVYVRVWTTGGPGLSNVDVTTPTFASGVAETLWNFGFNPPSFSFDLHASIESGTIIDTLATPLNWNQSPSAYPPPNRTSPAPVLTWTQLPETTPYYGIFRLDWTAVASPDTRLPRIEYRLESAPSATGPWTVQSTDILPDPTVLTQTRTNWTFGTYYFRVIGKEPTLGSGTYSNVVTVVNAPPIISGVAGPSWGTIAI